jgi:PKD repeat protein
VGAGSNYVAIVQAVPENQAPEVDAGSAQTITLPAAATLNGTVNDDGLPNPPGTFTTTWSRVSGPGNVIFAAANAVDTTATFSAAGTYVLQLTANDGDLTSNDNVTITVNSTPQAPVANAGSDQTVRLAVGAATVAVTLDARGSSDPGSQNLLFQWSATTAGSPDPADVPQPTVNLGVGTHTFSLVVVNEDGTSSVADQVTITVNSAQAPVANAGPDQSARLAVGAATVAVTLDARGSSDPGGQNLQFQWSATTAGSPDPADVPQPAVNLGVGTHTFSLVVVNEDGTSSVADQVTITVNATQAPVANAGPDQTVNEGDVVTLDGSSSTDADGTIVTFRWMQTMGTPVTLSDPSAAQLTFNAPAVGPDGEELPFQLTVTDNAGFSATDNVIITVLKCPHSCDVNQDSRITPADSLLAFQHFLSINETQLNACELSQVDVNQDGMVTPADALCILRNFLGLPSCLC